MIYPDNFEQKIGFDSVRRIIRQHILSSMGDEAVDAMRFDTRIHEINRQLSRTEEMLAVVRYEENFPANYFFDLRSSLARIRVEGLFLDEGELFDLRRSLETTTELVRFFSRDEAKEKYPSLRELTEKVELLPELCRRIDTILDKSGKIKDNASPELARIRRELISASSQISRTLHSILRQAQKDGYVDKDVAPSMRDGRLVIPIAPAFKRKIRGIVHDESATGKTVYIEPEAVVQANNLLRELEGDERREIVRILTDLTNFLRPTTPILLQSFYFLGQIDFLRAKALFANDVQAIRPSVEDSPLLLWYEAKHPLLDLALRRQHKTIVPLDLELDTKQRILLISGPNAGGKSVCLKTVGLLQYMMQCGLLIPLHERSRAGLFHDLFIDIGDEQSIENDLSTYSSHLTNMKQFVRSCSKRSLLLIDEFGGGTEPQIGGAIAESLLERFNRREAFGVITTHYQNLKHFAENTPGIVNGAMLYDRHQMQPLFRLSIGNPGSSFAIEIARKIGLPEEVIADASEKVGSDYINMDKYLQDIVRDKRYWETKRQEIRKKEKSTEELAQRYEEELTRFDQTRKEAIRNAKAEAEALLNAANATIENTIRKIKENQAEKESTRAARQELSDFRNELQNQLEQKVQKTDRKMQSLIDKQSRKKDRKTQQEVPTPAAPKKREVKPLQVGDYVRLKGSSTVGQLIEIKSNRATLTVGSIKTTADPSKLERAQPPAPQSETTAATFISSSTQSDLRDKRLNFRREIDLRGMRGDEALLAVTLFIDDALLVNVDKVRILHGTGTGALRTLIRSYLASCTDVVDYHDEHVQYGGTGITVVEFT